MVRVVIIENVRIYVKANIGVYLDKAYRAVGVYSLVYFRPTSCRPINCDAHVQ